VSNNVDFVIGGKDKATAPMTAVESQMKRLQASTDRMAASTATLTRLTTGIAGAYAAFKGAMAAMGGIGAINAAYDAQADAVRGLETALRLNGDEVANNSARLTKFAAEMQSFAGIGDEATIGLMKQARTLGVGADQLEAVTKATIGLAEATGKGLDASMRTVQQAMEGNFEAIQRQIPAIKSMTTDEEKLAAVMDLATRGLLAKADASQTVSGTSERASNAFGDLMESVGALIAPFRMLINQGIITLSESLQTVLGPAVEYANKLLENIGPLMDWVKAKVVQAVNGIIAAFTFIEVGVTNLDKVWAVMVAQAELYLLQLSGAVMHALTVVIPAYASWFAENFVALIRDGLVAAVTISMNHVRKLIDTFRALWDFIASGGSSDVLGQLGEIAGRSYLEGFESTVSALPDIAGRQISQREKDLAETVGSIGESLGEEFAAKFAARAIKMGDGVGDALATDIDVSLNKKIDDKLGEKGFAGAGGGQAALQASEGRLLTRGPAERREDIMQKIADGIAKLLGPTEATSAAAMASESELREIRQNTANQTQLVPTL